METNEVRVKSPENRGGPLRVNKLTCDRTNTWLVTSLYASHQSTPCKYFVYCILLLYIIVNQLMDLYESHMKLTWWN